MTPHHATHHHDPDHPYGHDHAHPRGVRGLLTSIFAPHSHDPADSIDSALESSAEGIRAVKISLLVLLATAVAQLVVVVLTGSVALLADTVHNFSDAMTAVPLWIAFVLARRAPTRRYTYGLGRAEDVAGLFIVLMIALSALVAGFESVRRLIEPRDITHVWVVLGAGVIGFLGNEIVAGYRIRVGQRIGSAALVADGLHARTDGFTSLAVAAGAIGVLAGFPLADPIVGLVITVAILAVLKGAATEVFSRVLDGVDPALVAAAERALRASPRVVDVDEVRMRWIGHRLHAESVIRVDRRLGLCQADDVAHDAEHAVHQAVPQMASFSVRARPSEE